jgi:phosphate transport system permease protein
MGETMAVTMIIGNAAPKGYSLFSAGQTISSELANQFNNADTDTEKQALLYLALVLLAITLVINGVARMILLRVSGKKRR